MLAEQSRQQAGEQLTCLYTELSLGCHVQAGQVRSQQRLAGFGSDDVKGSWLLWGHFARTVTTIIRSTHPEQLVILKERRTGTQPAE